MKKYAIVFVTCLLSMAKVKAAMLAGEGVSVDREKVCKCRDDQGVLVLDSPRLIKRKKGHTVKAARPNSFYFEDSATFIDIETMVSIVEKLRAMPVNTLSVLCSIALGTHTNLELKYTRTILSATLEALRLEGFVNAKGTIVSEDYYQTILKAVGMTSEGDFYVLQLHGLGDVVS